MKPDVHLCSLVCRLKCWTGQHHRAPEGKCRCCGRFSVNTAHELARSRDWEKLTTGWWKDEAA